MRRCWQRQSLRSPLPTSGFELTGSAPSPIRNPNSRSSTRFAPAADVCCRAPRRVMNRRSPRGFSHPHPRISKKNGHILAQTREKPVETGEKPLTNKTGRLIVNIGAVRRTRMKHRPHACFRAVERGGSAANELTRRPHCPVREIGSRAYAQSTQGNRRNEHRSNRTLK
jgi:hypothetical protein